MLISDNQGNIKQPEHNNVSAEGHEDTVPLHLSIWAGHIPHAVLEQRRKALQLQVTSDRTHKKQPVKREKVLSFVFVMTKCLTETNSKSKGLFSSWVPVYMHSPWLQ